ncbi:hypothetical protein DPMN_120004 [Dreissena polymorpha]|uniref:Uncharacterized protein n=1 Tax=Dreissena polymorpha TaxID=45954 RepID=A0A9D4GJL0_DREPO|nr:hypothetical protein DPMN_120004 [Dreissena polymorpha]
MDNVEERTFLPMDELLSAAHSRPDWIMTSVSSSRRINRPCKNDRTTKSARLSTHTRCSANQITSAHPLSQQD